MRHVGFLGSNLCFVAEVHVIQIYGGIWSSLYDYKMLEIYKIVQKIYFLPLALNLLELKSIFIFYFCKR